MREKKHNLLKCTKISEFNLLAFIYRLFQEDFSSLIGTNTVGVRIFQLTCKIHARCISVLVALVWNGCHDKRIACAVCIWIWEYIWMKSLMSRCCAAIYHNKNNSRTHMFNSVQHFTSILLVNQVSKPQSILKIIAMHPVPQSGYCSWSEGHGFEPR